MTLGYEPQPRSGRFPPNQPKLHRTAVPKEAEPRPARGKGLNAHLDHYNGERPHRALGGLAPLEYLARMQAESVPQSVSDVLTDYRLQHLDGKHHRHYC